MRRRSATVSIRQTAQMPRSRSNTHSRRYDVLERRRHSWTQASEQNVRRRPLTAPLHHRHDARLSTGQVSQMVPRIKHDLCASV